MYDVELCLVTPEMARDLLPRNKSNRRLEQRRVDSYADDMRNDRWNDAVAEPIHIAKDGTLLNGQHRLHAVIQSGCSVKMQLMTGMDPRDQEKLDLGRPRSLSDILQLRGEKHAPVLAGSAAYVWGWKNGKDFRQLAHAWRPGPHALLETIDQHPNLRAYLDGAQRLTSMKLPPSFTAYHLYRASMIDKADQEDFMHRLHERLFEGEYDPLRVLYNTLLKDAGSHRRASQVMRHAWLVKSWNAYRRGIEIRHLRFSPGGSRKEPFPQPE